MSCLRAPRGEKLTLLNGRCSTSIRLLGWRTRRSRWALAGIMAAEHSGSPPTPRACISAHSGTIGNTGQDAAPGIHKRSGYRFEPASTSKPRRAVKRERNVIEAAEVKPPVTDACPGGPAAPDRFGAQRAHAKLGVTIPARIADALALGCGTREGRLQLTPRAPLDLAMKRFWRGGRAGSTL